MTAPVCGLVVEGCVAGVHARWLPPSSLCCNRQVRLFMLHVRLQVLLFMHAVLDLAYTCA